MNVRDERLGEWLRENEEHSLGGQGGFTHICKSLLCEYLQQGWYGEIVQRQRAEVFIRVHPGYE